MTVSVKKYFALSMIFLITGTLLVQASEPILNTTYQSSVKPALKTISYTQPSQIAEMQAKPHSILWLGDMEHATELSLQTGRPILVHFEQPNCQGSRHVNQTTFRHPEFIQVIYNDFVPVRINVLAKPELGKKYKITQTPTDIILDAEGELVYRGITEPNAASYATKLATFGAVSNKHKETLDIDVGFEVDTVDFNTSQPMNPDVAPANYPQAIQNQPRYRPQYQTQADRALPQYQNQPENNYVAPQHLQQVPLPQNGQGLPAAYPQQPVLQTQPQQQIHQPPTEGQLQPPRVQLPQRNQPRLGLNGYCPVSLSDLNNGGAQWVKGDPQFGIIHRGRLYLFAGQHQLDIFKKYPERLAPVISGYDPVVFTDQRKLVDGIRELGVSYKGKVYLFNSKQSLQQFWTAPDRYANQATAAMQRTR